MYKSNSHYMSIVSFETKIRPYHSPTLNLLMIFQRAQEKLQTSCHGCTDFEGSSPCLHLLPSSFALKRLQSFPPQTCHTDAFLGPSHLHFLCLYSLPLHSVSTIFLRCQFKWHHLRVHPKPPNLNLCFCACECVGAHMCTHAYINTFSFYLIVGFLLWFLYFSETICVHSNISTHGCCLWGCMSHSLGPP